MKSIQEHLLQLLQMVPTSYLLQAPLCLDALFEQCKQKQKANKPVKKLFDLKIDENCCKQTLASLP